jgi:hypothetical protein
MDKQGLLFLIISILFFSLSCKTVKKLNKTQKGISIENVYDSLNLASPVYNKLEIKFNLDYENTSLKGSLKMAKDSIIWISLSPGLGFDVARIMFNKDSIFILDMLNKTYTTGDYAYIKNKWKIDADFNSLQSILVGKFFIYPNVNDEKKEFISTYNIKKDSSELEIYRKTGVNVENLLKIDRQKYKIDEYVINDITEMRNLTIKYSFSRLEEGFEFPKKISLKSNNAGKFLNIDINYTKVTINGNPKFSFSVPASYSTVKH